MRRRHALYLSEALTQSLTTMAERHRVSKSEILRGALQRYLASASDAVSSDLIALAQQTNTQALRRIERDLAIATELTATFVRYFLMTPPPLPASEHQAARALGNMRFEQVIESVARRLGTDRSLMSRVMLNLNGTAPGAAHAQTTPVEATTASANAHTVVENSLEKSQQ